MRHSSKSTHAPRRSRIMRVLRWCDANLEETLVVALLLYLVAAVCTEVFRRYVLDDSGPWSEEIARFAMIWLVYLGVPYSIKQRRHIICDVLPSRMPLRLTLAIDLISYGCFLAFVIVMVYQDYRLILTQIAADVRTEAMHVPLWYFSTAVGVGFGLAAVRLVQAVYWMMREAIDPKVVGDAWPWKIEDEQVVLD